MNISKRTHLNGTQNLWNSLLWLFRRSQCFSTVTLVHMLRWCIGTHRCVTQWGGLYVYHKELEFPSFPSFCLCILEKRPQFLIVHKTVFSIKRLCKCSNVKPSHVVQTFIKDTDVSRRLLLQCGCNKAQNSMKSRRCRGLQFRQSSWGVKNILFLLVPHTVKQS